VSKKRQSPIASPRPRLTTRRVAHAHAQVELIRGWAPLAAITRDVTQMMADTRSHLHDRTLIGWLTVGEFVALLDDPDVIA
jgi:hypothetical protein